MFKKQQSTKKMKAGSDGTAPRGGKGRERDCSERRGEEDPEGPRREARGTRAGETAPRGAGRKTQRDRAKTRREADPEGPR